MWQKTEDIFPYRSGTGGVQVNFTDIVQMLKKHNDYNPKTLEIVQFPFLCLKSEI